MDELAWNESLGLRHTYFKTQHGNIYFLPDSQHILSVNSQAVIELWNIRLRRPLYSRTYFMDHSKWADDMYTKLSPAGSWLALMFRNRHPLLWRTSTRTARYLTGADPEMRTTGFTSEKRLATVTVNGISVWDCANATFIEKIDMQQPPQIPPQIIETSAAVLIGNVADDSGSRDIALYSLHNGRTLFRTSPGAHSAVLATFTPRQGWLAIARGAKQIELYSTAMNTLSTLHPGARSSGSTNPDESAKPSPPNSEVTMLRFSNSGNILLSMTSNETAQLWRVMQSEDEASATSEGVSLGIYTNGRDYGLDATLSTKQWDRTILTLETSQSEWLEAFNQRLIWVPLQYRTSQMRGLRKGDAKAPWSL